MTDYPPSSTALAFLRCSLLNDKQGASAILEHERADDLLAGMLAFAELFGEEACGSRDALIARCEEWLRA